jgi:general secretion pathway protein J
MRNDICFPGFFRRSVRTAGFTLLEILIALFIFTILSLMMVGGLHSVINAQSGSEDKAERLRKLQMVLLVMSRDIEQAINRPIIDANGREEAAFVGTPQSMVFTHAGFANPAGAVARSTLQRTGYLWSELALSRLTWPVLDQAPQTKPHSRRLLTDVPEMQFQFLDKQGRFHDNWPLEDGDDEPLPRGVRIIMTVVNWGKLSELYLIAAQAGKNTQLPQKPGQLGSTPGSGEQKMDGKPDEKRE